MREIPDCCPSCSKRISISSGEGGDSTKIGWNCQSCGAFSFAVIEHPQITKGKKMAHLFEGVHPLDKRITRLPCNVQIGIFRKLQHPDEC